MSTVSVIIPNYNRASLVAETISNMLRQTLPPTEIIVVDDGSTDNSANVIRSFGDKVRLVQQTNQGPGAARNAGLQVASSEYIQFMDSDDLASLNKLQVQVEALQQTGADFAYGPWIRCHIEQPFISFLGDILQAGPVPPGKSMLEWFVSGWSLVFQNCVYRKSILDKAGRYRTDLMPSEDSEYFTRILLAGARPIFTPGCLVFYREQNLDKISASGTSNAHRANDWTHYLSITGNLLKDHLGTMHFSTRLATAAAVKAHLDYCRQHALTALTPDHPYAQLVNAIPAPLLRLADIQKRLRRRLLATADQHPAFRRAPMNAAYQQLVTAMQYQLR